VFPCADVNPLTDLIMLEIDRANGAISEVNSRRALRAVSLLAGEGVGGKRWLARRGVGCTPPNESWSTNISWLLSNIGSPLTASLDILVTSTTSKRFAAARTRHGIALASQSSYSTDGN
jgi:hypothetical protein